MRTPVAIYTAENCRPAYQLNWSLTVYWDSPASDDAWFADLQRAAEADGVRLLEHRFSEPAVSQFFISTTPQVAPPQLVRSVKGRLQHLVRREKPGAFRRHYGLRSVGESGRSTVEEYVRSQTDHHPAADPRVQEQLARHQIQCPAIDLSEPRQTSHGQFWYNLHLVLVHQERWRETREDAFVGTRRVIVAAARKHGHLLACGGILPDHLHLALGCDWNESPAQAALCYLNNLAYTAGQKPIFKFGFYVGTFGEYDRGAIRRHLASP